jgi:alginate O-acetyltransferase complex protein AlgI
MVFSSMIFLWIFLPVVFIFSLVIRKPQYQNLLLLAASLLFYAWGEPRNILLLLASIVLNWLFGLLIEKFRSRGKLILTMDIVVNLALLGYYKYTDFFLNTINHILPGVNLPLANIALPIGISFFTFQAMSYVIDLYRGQIKVQKNLLYLALYVSFFPQLIAGPIVKYRDIELQIENRTVNLERIASGFRRFIYGLGKKVLISNLVGQVVDNLYGLEVSSLTGGMAWLCALTYTLQIYYDFSGYSDMAIGLGRMFGFDFLENFNYPYLSCSIREFWRRWHISLSTWFQEYLYIPLGGNRKGKVRTYWNLLVVFFATGMWHGASWNFIAWGLYHGFFSILERVGLGKILKKGRILPHIYTMVVVMIGWVFFRVEEFSQGFAIAGRMLMPWRYTQTDVLLGTMVSSEAVLAIVCGILGCGVLQAVFSGSRTKKIAAEWKGSLPEFAFCSLVLIVCILKLASNTYNPFIYFRF